MRNLIIIFCLFVMACNTTKQTAAPIIKERIVYRDTIIRDTIREKFVIVDSLEKIAKKKKYPPVLVNFIEDPMDMVFAQAKKENKNVFIDFTASWCAPCLQMERETFSEKEVGNRLNADFINVRMDDENFDSYTMKSKYNVSQLPTYIILTPSGRELYRIVGFKYWIKFLEEIKPY